MDLRKLSPLDPLSFFSVALSVGQKKTLLPKIPSLYREEVFADLYLAWSNEGLEIQCDLFKPFEGSYFPDIEKGDALEILLDTRALVDLTYVHKYCHHFYFFPKEIDGVSALEVTRFKTEEKHPLADPKNFHVETTFSKKGYSMKIGIPRISLFGYDPEEVRRLSFAYVVHSHKERQEFPLPEENWRLRNHPNLWAEINLE